MESERGGGMCAGKSPPLAGMKVNAQQRTYMMFFMSTDRSLMNSSLARGSRRLDVLLGTQCIDFLIISPSCFAGDFCNATAHNASLSVQHPTPAVDVTLLTFAAVRYDVAAGDFH